MKILILNHNDENKGTYFRCQLIGKNLLNHGHKVSLSCYNPDSKAIKVKKRKDGSGLNIINVAGSHTLSSVTEMPYHCIRAIQNTNIALTGKYDAIMFTGVACPTTGFSLLLISVLKAVGIIRPKIIVDWDDLWGKNGLTALNNKGGIAVAVADLMETQLPKLADIVTVVSHNILNRAIAAGIDKKKIFYLPNGTTPVSGKLIDKDEIREKLGIKKSAVVLFFVGRALWTFDYLLASFKIIVNKYPNAIILYVSPLQEIHLKKIQKARLNNNVVFLGTRAYDELLELIIAADIALLPRENSEIEKANFPTRLCDYLSMGKPIVASSIGDEVEYIFNKYRCGLLADYDSPKDFAEKIMSYIKNPELREKVGKVNLIVARKLALKKTINEFNKILSNHD